MSRSLYELCRRYSDGELEISEYRRQRRQFINSIIKSGDQTQPLSDLFVTDVTQPKRTMPVAPAVNNTSTLNPSIGMGTQSAKPEQENNGRKGWIAGLCLLLLIASISVWRFGGVTERELPVDNRGIVTEDTTPRPLLVNMYLLLEQERWTVADIDSYLALLKERSVADDDLLHSDSRYHQFLDSIHIYQALAEADQDKPMVDKLRQMEQALRD
ncbi:hypothetical protein [Amphritea japonica]|nr:hypothetical protein [Amphritea japonica]